MDKTQSRNLLIGLVTLGLVVAVGGFMLFWFNPDNVESRLYDACEDSRAEREVGDLGDIADNFLKDRFNIDQSPECRKYEQYKRKRARQ